MWWRVEKHCFPCNGRLFKDKKLETKNCRSVSYRKAARHIIHVRCTLVLNNQEPGNEHWVVCFLAPLTHLFASFACLLTRSLDLVGKLMVRLFCTILGRFSH